MCPYLSLLRRITLLRNQRRRWLRDSSDNALRRMQLLQRPCMHEHIVYGIDQCETRCGRNHDQTECRIQTQGRDSFRATGAHPWDQTDEFRLERDYGDDRIETQYLITGGSSQSTASYFHRHGAIVVHRPFGRVAAVRVDGLRLRLTPEFALRSGNGVLVLVVRMGCGC